ncbi:MAG: UvrB/UvrC motif-containing protein [Opitutaceae bacterium]
MVAELEDEMNEAAGRLEFERAAVLRDQINALKSGDYKRSASAAADYPGKKKRRRG